MKKYRLHYSRSSGVGSTLPVDSLSGVLGFVAHLLRQLSKGESISFSVVVEK